MKVVLFCGGQGMRLREFSDKIPKPMVPIGYRPILWYIMKYYAHFGHKDFILCLGYMGDAIKNYFVNYDEYLSNDFVYSKGGKDLNLINKDIDDWTITFADTGINTSLGERLLLVKKYLKDEPCFLVNYSDVLTDLPLNDMIAHFQEMDKIGMFMVTPPQRSFHVVHFDENNEVNEISALSKSGLWVNAGYFILKKEIFEYLGPGDDLVDNAIQKLLAKNNVSVYPYHGTWLTMDTFKEKQMLDDMYSKGDTPWEVWKGKGSKENFRYSLIMLSVNFADKPGGLKILCLGAHCDDIEIGCGGTIMRLVKEHDVQQLKWLVFTSTEERAAEARTSAAHFVQGCRKTEITIKNFKDGFLPYEALQVKNLFEEIKPFDPDIIFTHYRHDLHQDHRTVCELTWNTFRNHLIFEYEIPKYDGDLGGPNCFVTIDERDATEKVNAITNCFRSQTGKQWFDKDTFFSLMRIRGIESCSPSRYAEGFYVRKSVM